MKRVVLFLATNIAVLVVLGIVLQLLGVDSLLDEQGVDLDLRALLIFATVLSMHKEHRYMLPAYPAYAALAAFVADRLRIALDRRPGFFLGTVLLLVALALSAAWSVPMGLADVFHNVAVIERPW